MLARTGRSLLHPSEAALNRAIIWLSVALVAATTAFAVYYYIDRRPGSDSSVLDREIAQMEEVVISDPGSLAARYSLANAYMMADRAAEAAEQYRAALQIDDTNLAAIAGLGRALLKAGDGDGAIEQFEAIVAAAEHADIPGDLVQAAHYYLGRIYLDQGNAVAAEQELEAAVAIERSDADSLYLLGIARSRFGDLDGAIEALTQATRYVPSFAEAYDALVGVYQQGGMALEGRYARAMYAYSTGELDRAEKLLEEVVAEADTFVPALVGLGLVRETSGDRGGAIEAYMRARELEPDEFNAGAGLFRLGVLLPDPTQEGATAATEHAQ